MTFLKGKQKYFNSNKIFLLSNCELPELIPFPEQTQLPVTLFKIDECSQGSN